MILVIEFGRVIGRRWDHVPVCDLHAGQAQPIARRHDGIAYRLRPI